MGRVQEQLFPRVLIVGAAPIASNSATGITLSNLFSGWPSESIAQIYDDVTEPDPLICSTHFRFSSQDIFLVKNAKKIFRANQHYSTTSSENTKKSGQLPELHPTFGLLQACGDIAPIKLPSTLMTWVSEFRPDLIYSVLGSVRMMSIVSKISTKFSLPVVPHFMDDWPATLYSDSAALRIPQIILQTRLHHLLSKCRTGLGICADMAHEFSNRYKIPFDYFMNCVNILPPNSSHSNDGCIVFGFVGGMHLNRWKSLLSLTKALQGLKDEGKSVRIDIYSQPKYIQKYGDLLKEYSVVGNMDSLKAEDVDKKLQSLDILVHVESFLEEDARYTRLSISTKIPQYMASSKPILGIGPETLSSIRYIERTNAGLVCTREDDLDQLRHLSNILIESSEKRSSLGANGYRTAVESHDLNKEKERFRTVLTNALRRD